MERKIFVYPHLSNGMGLNVDTLKQSACSNPDIASAWSECTMGIDNIEKTIELLQQIVKTWITIRGHSIFYKKGSQMAPLKNY